MMDQVALKDRHFLESIDEQLSISDMELSHMRGMADFVCMEINIANDLKLTKVILESGT